MTVELDISNEAISLADLVARARAGEEIVFADAGRPVARLVPAEEEGCVAARVHGFGVFKGEAWMSDDFREPLTEEELKDWGLEQS